ncbi:MAG: TlpA family protein disulfide reductase [Flavobacteriales bacterium]|nr:MAG: TlpA family protein disulfide reductase [Flavobacteriales bacterium]
MDALLRLLLVLSFCLSLDPSLAQSQGWTLLEGAHHQMESVSAGEYSFEYRFKSLTNNDTSTSHSLVYFEKNTEDSIYGMNFSRVVLDNGIKKYGAINNSEAYIRVNYNDSTATLMSKIRWSETIEGLKHNDDLYPLLRPSNILKKILRDDFLADGVYDVELLNNQYIDGRNCRPVRIVYDKVISDEQAKESFQLLGVTWVFWICETSGLVIQFTENLKARLNGAEMFQYSAYRLTSFDFDSALNANVFLGESLPDFFAFKEYQPPSVPELLRVGDKAPDFRLPTFSGDSVSLSANSGRVVLLDFFYKSCFPCISAIPGLVELRNTFSPDDFLLLGLNPFDKKKALGQFIESQGINYTVCLDAKKVAEAYRVQGYPTVYLIDQRGYIAFVGVGYSSEAELELHEAVKKLLTDD